MEPGQCRHAHPAYRNEHDRAQPQHPGARYLRQVDRTAARLRRLGVQLPGQRRSRRHDLAQRGRLRTDVPVRLLGFPEQRRPGQVAEPAGCRLQCLSVRRHGHRYRRRARLASHADRIPRAACRDRASAGRHHRRHQATTSASPPRSRSPRRPGPDSPEGMPLGRPSCTSPPGRPTAQLSRQPQTRRVKGSLKSWRVCWPGQ